MRLLFVNEKLGFASTSSYTLDLALAVKKAGDDLQVATTGGDLRKYLTDHGVPTYLIKSNIFSFRKLLEFLREFNPDLVHIQSLRSAWIGQKISRRLRVPHVTTVHRVPSAASARLAHPNLCGVIAAGEVIREALVNSEGVPKNIIRVIQPGVDVETLAPSESTWHPPASQGLIPVIGSVGRLTQVKGHHVFIEAARRVLDAGVEAMFAIVGEGEEERHLRGLVKSLGLEHQVTFSPHISQRRELYAAFDIVVVPNLRGGLGSTALEAMSLAKPLIATAAGEILHIVQDRKTGLLVPEGDVAGLTACILELLRNPDLARSLALASRRFVVENFALEPMVAATREFYGESLARHRERSLVSLAAR